MLFRLRLRLERCFLLNVIRLFRIRGQSERVSRGFATGMIVNFYPTFGFGVLISGVVAQLLGGNLVAGLVGGAALALAWPLLFYLNIRVGGWVVKPAIAIDELEDVTEKTIDALVWGKTFMTGAIINSTVVGLLVYVLFRLAYHQMRPVALAYFRRHARDHQRRFQRPR